MTDIPPVEIAANDCYLIRVGAECVITAAKKACTLNIELDIDDGGASMRDAQASAVKDLIDERMESTEPWACPGHLVRTARIGVSLHLGQIDKLKEKEIDLFLPDTKETDKRIKQLTRILSTLDGQGALAIDDE